MWDQLRRLNDDLSPLLNNDLGKLSSRLSSLADQMRANYVKVGEGRKIDQECWIAARALQYHVTTNSKYTSRDDALRHVTKLIHTVNKTIDSDSDVASLKELMEDKIQQKLGAEKAAELHKERVYLAKPEDVDF
jgi:methionyl-tRNA synthetase